MDKGRGASRSTDLQRAPHSQATRPVHEHSRHKHTSTHKHKHSDTNTRPLVCTQALAGAHTHMHAPTQGRASHLHAGLGGTGGPLGQQGLPAELVGTVLRSRAGFFCNHVCRNVLIWREGGKCHTMFLTHKRNREYARPRSAFHDHGAFLHWFAVGFGAMELVLLTPNILVLPQLPF